MTLGPTQMPQRLQTLWRNRPWQLIPLAALTCWKHFIQTDRPHSVDSLALFQPDILLVLPTWTLIACNQVYNTVARLTPGHMPYMVLTRNRFSYYYAPSRVTTLEIWPVTPSHLSVKVISVDASHDKLQWLGTFLVVILASSSDNYNVKIWFMQYHGKALCSSFTLWICPQLLINSVY